MKKLEELGISPAPWTHKLDNGMQCNSVWDARCGCVLSGGYTESVKDARLIATAPKLYKVCYRIERWEDYAKAHNRAIEPWSNIMHDLHNALAEAAGEEAANEN